MSKILFFNPQNAMDYHIVPSSLKGTLAVPSSKSQTLRAILFGMMGRGKSYVLNPLSSPDVDAMLLACKLLGCRIEKRGNSLEIEGLKGAIQGAENVIDAGNSGQVLRFIGALAALSSEMIVLTGDASLRSNRPVQPLLGALSQLGALAISVRNNGFAPILIRGPMYPGKTHLLGEDSQPVSGLLMACAFARGETQIHVSQAGEKPWVEVTLSWFDRLGIAYKNENFEKYTLFGGASYAGFSYEVPGDFSTAAFLIAGALLTDSEISIEGLDMCDAQGDKQLIYLLQQMGAKIEIEAEKRRIVVKRGGELVGGIVDVNDCIDALPVLSVIGCFTRRGLEIVNAKIARRKESDRIRAMACELKKMGARVQEREEGLLIEPSSLTGAPLESYSDHRVAMALCVAGLAAQGKTIVSGAECIAKSYSGFYEDILGLGGKISRG